MNESSLTVPTQAPLPRTKSDAITCNAERTTDTVVCLKEQYALHVQSRERVGICDHGLLRTLYCESTSLRKGEEYNPNPMLYLSNA